MGPSGMKEIGERILANSHYALKRFREEGLSAPFFDGPFFEEFAVSTTLEGAELSKHLAGLGILGGMPLSRFYPSLRNVSLFSFSELHSAKDIEQLVSSLRSVESKFR
jgi:glycine dehydrogenase subunit 1